MNIDLYEKIPGASDFKYIELIKSQTAKRKGIDNSPNKEQWGNLLRLSRNVLQPVRFIFGPIVITSGFRCETLNTAIGGSSSSNHVRGEAADIEPANENISLMKIIRYIYKNLEFRELIAEFFPDGWVHVAYRECSNKGVLKLKDKDHSYEVVSLDYLEKLYG